MFYKAIRFFKLKIWLFNEEKISMIIYAKNFLEYSASFIYISISNQFYCKIFFFSKKILLII